MRLLCRHVLASSALWLCATAQATEDWPTHYTFADGTDVRALMNYQYDVQAIDSNDGTGLAGAHTNRRKEFGAIVRRKHRYEAFVYFDFQSKQWLDVTLRLDTRWLGGPDRGMLRVGHFRPPVGLEGLTASRADSFIERALTTQAFFQSRRTGADWTFERKHYLINAAYFFGQDLQGKNDGATQALRLVWAPIRHERSTLHLGLAASREIPRATVDGRGQRIEPSARWRARPEAGLTPIRLIDSGTLTNVTDIRRVGVEHLLIHGPFSVQGEYLRQTTRRHDARAYRTAGGYVSGSWVLTGESRPYAGGNVANIRPRRSTGAFELLVRHSRLDLNDAGIHGGRERNWTAGINWYASEHIKCQLNHVRAQVTQASTTIHPRITELRAQVHF